MHDTHNMNRALMWDFEANENETIPSYVTHVDSYVINRRLITFPQLGSWISLWRDRESNPGLSGESEILSTGPGAHVSTGPIHVFLKIIPREISSTSEIATISPRENFGYRIREN